VSEYAIIGIVILLAWPAGLGLRTLVDLLRELEERRRFARDLEGWIAELGLE
jgi:hypothetical protein